jgi:uncharacterized protein DUF4394
MSTIVTAIQQWTKLFLSTSLMIAASALIALPATAGELLVGSTSNNRLVVFSSDNPRRVKTLRVRGLAPNERILGLDVRPANGQLYALGSTSQIYIIDLQQRVATPVGSPFSPALRGDFFGFDFNPQADRIRIVSDADQNLRVNPDTGAVAGVDTELDYVVGDSGAGLDPGAVGAAYSNNDNDQATPTTLYDIDATRDTLVVQNPPNNGALTTVGSLGVTTTHSLVVGFDIAASDGTAYALLRPEGSDFPQLYRIDLTTGAASFIGQVGGLAPLTSLATLGPAR